MLNHGLATIAHNISPIKLYPVQEVQCCYRPFNKSFMMSKILFRSDFATSACTYNCPDVNTHFATINILQTVIDYSNYTRHVNIPAVYSLILLCCSYDCRLEGSPPGVKMAGGVPGFSAPRLPLPGQKVAKKNALKIEKYVHKYSSVSIFMCI